MYGVIAFVWHDFSIWHHAKPGSLPLREIIVYAAAVVNIVGGVLMQWRRTLSLGSAIVAAIMLLFTVLTIPGIIAAANVYTSWGNFFERLSLFCGAAIVFAETGPRIEMWRARAAQTAYFLFGLCAVSFAIEQALYLKATADFVPAWIPPNQMFWAIATTIGFALAAVAIFSGRYALLATQLLTAMLVGFGVLVWVPRLFSTPPMQFTWAETTETFGIAAAAWIVAVRLYDLRARQ
ncbi:MAG: hypothetical protein M3Y21_05085 [Candidatus Eremiobacteraeota bacterium]|nr:hypothetical protein [Candidatus Eremiobacteraeota bacterium]